MSNQNFVPSAVEGTKYLIPSFPGYEWIKKLPNKRIYFALFQRWPTISKSHDKATQNLPAGYDYYIVSFHLEAVDTAWLKQQQVTGPIIVLADGQSYDFKIPGVYFLPFFYWHYQLEQMHKWFGIKEKTNPKYKFSAVCNRISQSKLWITTKLLDVARESSLIILNSWLEEKNVHGWQPTGNSNLDQLTQLFRDRYLGQEIKDITDDDFDSSFSIENQTFGDKDNHAKSANPWQPLYQDCAVHFTNESFHYSGMVEDGQQYIWPGPFITEKTLKCLLGGTAFVPVGQFETYRTLENLGLQFDYKFDTAWDLDPGNISRAESIVTLIDDLNQFTVEQLVNKTQDSNRYNQNHIVTGKFFDRCQQKNEESIVRIFDLIS
jgi:hypothetical protein